MSRRLISLNIALLAALLGVTVVGIVSGRAGAQPGSGTTTPGALAPSRLRGDYTMVAGRIQGATTSAVYIVDAANQEVVALTWDRTNNRFEPLGHRSFFDDARYLTKPR